ncbi:4a-hydroxytetrahydrobiopterin dehydratase [Panacagrimonas sp.]|uniref:4a-hydroxytetrahydrobiopterin dehydratase n=1 Tax=Panacagrimonas sp. TaxID=2480088 RepID=UPI003B521CFF
MTELTNKRCVPCEGGVPALDAAACAALMPQLQPRWTLAGDSRALAATFEFKNYYHTTAFVNAVIYVAHREDHHPDVNFGYKTCEVRYWTHAVGGLTENDFICAAKIDALMG